MTQYSFSDFYDTVPIWWLLSHFKYIIIFFKSYITLNKTNNKLSTIVMEVALEVSTNHDWHKKYCFYSPLSFEVLLSVFKI